MGEIERHHRDASLGPRAQGTAEGGSGLPIVWERRPGRQLAGLSPASFKIGRSHVGRPSGRYAYGRRVSGAQHWIRNRLVQASDLIFLK
jgi:hypothetical protein